MKIGGHVSIAGGYAEALHRATAIGANCMQMFSTSPRGWGVPTVEREYVREFRLLREKLRINPIFFHASYLVNLADAGRIGEQSVASLTAEMRVAGALGVRGSIIHLGSHRNSHGDEGVKGRAVLLKNIKTVLRSTPDETRFIIENAGTRKIGQDLREIAEILSEVGSKRLSVCLDTCHLHAAGYDLATKSKFDTFLREFDRAIGFSRLALIHTNDSRDPFGSLRDRHENIGDGEVPKKVFQLLLSDKRTRDLPFILEVPGINGDGPDAENIRRLRALAGESVSEARS